DTAATQGVGVDRSGYERAMEGQRDKARSASGFSARQGDEFALPSEGAELKGIGDQFEGYQTTRVTGVPVVAVFDEQRHTVDVLTSGQRGYVALARTPFYLEAGGQVSDSGQIVNEATGASAVVEGLSRIRAGLPRA